MSDLYIIAAGKGSRMGSNIPKALVPFKGEPCLTTTLKNIGHNFDNVFVVINSDIREVWDEYADSLIIRNANGSVERWAYSSNVTFVTIKSGLGDGHAVLAALNKAPTAGAEIRTELSNDIVICWGDVYFHQPEIIRELLSMKLVNGIIPANKEDNPYVTLLVDNQLACVSADFSKYGESHPTGFHDQSLFRFNRQILKSTLERLHKAFWKNGRYITPGGELSLLHTFHYLYNMETPAHVYESNYSTKSFNTQEEVSAIRTEITYEN